MLLKINWIKHCWVSVIHGAWISSWKFQKCIQLLFLFPLWLDLNQTDAPQEDEFDRAKEQQDLVLGELVPKMNKEATKLVDVYNLTDLIDSDTLGSLNDEAINVLKASPEALLWVFIFDSIDRTYS